MNRNPLARRAPSRCVLLAAAVAAAVGAAAPARAQSLAAGEWRVGSAFGVELGMGDEKYGSAKVRVEAERDWRELSPEARLGLVVSLGLSHPSDEVTVPIGFDPFTGTFETAELTWDANVFELIPAARVTWTASPVLSFHADAGLGLAYTAANVELPGILADLGIEGEVDDGIAGVLRLAGGVFWTPRPGLRVGVEGVGLHVRFGGGVGTAFDLLATVSHRL